MNAMCMRLFVAYETDPMPLGIPGSRIAGPAFVLRLASLVIVTIIIVLVLTLIVGI